MEPRDPNRRAVTGLVVDEQAALTAEDLCRACGASVVQIDGWVAEGVLEPEAGASRAEWRFAGASLVRTRLAVRLERDLALNPPGVALALELLDEIAALRSRLRR